MVRLHPARSLKKLICSGTTPLKFYGVQLRMQRSLAILFGTLFIILGVLGFIPSLMEHGLLFGVFRLNFEHNAAHLILGTLGVFSGLSSIFYSRIYFILAGILYGFLAILGFMGKQEMLLQMIAVNTADNYLHTATALLFLIIGFRPSR